MNEKELGITTLENIFEGKKIRVCVSEGEPWFPLSDLADAWGVARNTLAMHLTRNTEKYAGFVSVVHVTCSRDEIQEDEICRCVNEKGLYLLLGSIQTARLKHAHIADAILRFQRWVPALIQSFRKNEIGGPRNLRSELSRAKLIAELPGGELAAFQAIALRTCGEEKYIPALRTARRVLVHGETGVWLNAAQIGKRCGRTAREVNRYLEWHKYQYRSHTGIWRLTNRGEEYGKEYNFETLTKHPENRILWRVSILAASGLTPEPGVQTELSP